MEKNHFFRDRLISEICKMCVLEGGSLTADHRKTRNVPLLKTDRLHLHVVGLKVAVSLT